MGEERKKWEGWSSTNTQGKRGNEAIYELLLTYLAPTTICPDRKKVHALSTLPRRKLRSSSLSS